MPIWQDLPAARQILLLLSPEWKYEGRLFLALRSPNGKLRCDHRCSEACEPGLSAGEDLRLPGSASGLATNAAWFVDGGQEGAGSAG